MNSNEGKQKFFVVYQITNLIDDKIYVGAHITHNINDKYMGSSKYLKKDIKELGRQNFKKDILHVFDNKEDMISKEAEIVNREFCHRPDTYNKREGGNNNFTNINMLSVKDNMNNVFLVYRDDPRYLSGELISTTTGTLSVIDEYGNSFRINKNDERWLTGQLKSTSKNKKLSIETKEKISIQRIGKFCGEKNGFFNKTHTEETKAIIRESRKRFFKNKKEKGEKCKGHPISEESKIKISEAGKKAIRKKILCPHCLKEGDSRNMKRYHFDNCNYREKNIIFEL